MRSLIFKAALAALLIATPLGSTFAAPGHGGGHGGGRSTQGMGGHTPGSGAGGSATALDDEYAQMYANTYGYGWYGGPATTAVIGTEFVPQVHHHHYHHHHPAHVTHGTAGAAHGY